MWEGLILGAGILLFLSSYKQYNIISVLGGVSCSSIVGGSFLGLFDYLLTLQHGVILLHFLGCFLYSVPLWYAQPKYLKGTSLITLTVFITLLFLEGVYLLDFLNNTHILNGWVDVTVNLIAFVTLIITNIKRGLHNGLNIMADVSRLCFRDNLVNTLHTKGS